MTRRSRTTSRARAAATPAAPDVQAKRLASALFALAKGLPNPWDESTDYFHSFAAAMPAGTELTAESLRKALGIGARYQIDLSSADSRLARITEADWAPISRADFASFRR